MTSFIHWASNIVYATISKKENKKAYITFPSPEIELVWLSGTRCSLPVQLRSRRGWYSLRYNQTARGGGGMEEEWRKWYLAPRRIADAPKKTFSWNHPNFMFYLSSVLQLCLNRLFTWYDMHLTGCEIFIYSGRIGLLCFYGILCESATLPWKGFDLLPEQGLAQHAETAKIWSSTAANQRKHPCNKHDCQPRHSFHIIQVKGTTTVQENRLSHQSAIYVESWSTN